MIPILIIAVSCFCAGICLAVIFMRSSTRGFYGVLPGRPDREWPDQSE